MVSTDVVECTISTVHMLSELSSNSRCYLVKLWVQVSLGTGQYSSNIKHIDNIDYNQIVYVIALPALLVKLYTSVPMALCRWYSTLWLSKDIDYHQTVDSIALEDPRRPSCSTVATSADVHRCQLDVVQTALHITVAECINDHRVECSLTSSTVLDTQILQHDNPTSLDISCCEPPECVIWRKYYDYLQAVTYLCMLVYSVDQVDWYVSTCLEPLQNSCIPNVNRLNIVTYSQHIRVYPITTFRIVVGCRSRPDFANVQSRGLAQLPHVLHVSHFKDFGTVHNRFVSSESTWLRG
jgi:hypothetical protein